MARYYEVYNVETGDSIPGADRADLTFDEAIKEFDRWVPRLVRPQRLGQISILAAIRPKNW